MSSSAIIVIAVIALIVYIIRQNNKAGIYIGWIGLGIVILGIAINSEPLFLLGCAVLLASWYIAWRKMKDNAAAAAAPPARRGFSNDIYQAIEEFGRLSYQCKQATQWAYDERDHGMITVTEGANGVRLEISCCGDCIACRLPSEYRWLYNDDNPNEIKYVAENLTGYVRETYGSTPSDGDSLFYFFKQGNPRAIGTYLWTERNGEIVNMAFKLR